MDTRLSDTELVTSAESQPRSHYGSVALYVLGTGVGFLGAFIASAGVVNWLREGRSMSACFVIQVGLLGATSFIVQVFSRSKRRHWLVIFSSLVYAVILTWWMNVLRD